MIGLAIVVSMVLIVVSYMISHTSNYPKTYSSVNDEGESKSQYECGIEPIEEEIGKETRERIYLKFYIVGILYLIFDLETILILPSSLCLSNSSILSTLYPVVIIFIIILLIGLYYEYNKKVI